MIERIGRAVARHAVILVALAMVAVVVQPAAAQERGDMANRLDRLERDIRTLHRMIAGKAPANTELGTATASGASGAPADHESLARLDVRLTALESDLRAATGRVEEVSHQMTLVERRLDKLVADIDFRLSNLEKGRVVGAPPAASDASAAPAADTAPPQPAMPGALPPPAAQGTLGTITPEDLAKVGEPNPAAVRASQAPAPAMPASNAPAAPAPRAAPNPAAVTAAAPGTTGSATPSPGTLPEGTAQQQYTYAFGFLRQNKFDEAEAALRAFIAAHPDDDLAGNARYWLGETYYVRREYVKSAEVFLDGYQKNPAGNKAPDTLLKLGMSLANLDKKREACSTFAKLVKDFPTAPNSILTMAGREREKNGCQ